MLESSPFPTARQLALVAFLCAVAAAFATAYSDPRVWWLLAPAVLSVAWRPRRIPDRLRRALPYLGWVVAGLTVVYGTAWTLYPVIPDRLVALFPRVAGYVLIGLASTFTLGSRVWSPARTAIGAGLCALMVAAFETAPTRRPAMTVAFTAAALIAFLFLEDVAAPTSSPHRWRRLGLAVAFCAAPAAIALGLIRLLPWAQPHVEQATAGLINTGAGIHFAGLSSSSRLGDIEQIALSRRVVMRVWSPRAQRLRARVFTGFDGRSWHVPASKPVALVPASGAEGDPKLLRGLEDVPGTLFVVPGTVEGRDAGSLVPTRIVQEVFNAGVLVTPRAPVRIRLAAARLRMEPAGVLVPLADAPEIYGIVNAGDGGSLDRADPAFAPGPESTQVPPRLDPRLAALAEQLARGTASDHERIRRTVGHVQTSCHYSLEVGPFRSAQPVAEFLFDKKRGYCEYFATATALLLRMQGVPARYVTGFNVQETNWESGHYVVRESDAHAWIEAYVDGQGWMEADSTPGAEYAAVHERLRGGPLAAALESLKAAWAELKARFGAGDWRGALAATWRAGRRFLQERPWSSAAILALLLAGTGRSWTRRLRRRPPRRPAPRTSLPPELAVLMARLDALWSRRGSPRPASQTPLEHLARLPAQRFPADAVEGARRVVERVYSARFGGAMLSPAEIQSLQAQIAAIQRSLSP